MASWKLTPRRNPVHRKKLPVFQLAKTLFPSLPQPSYTSEPHLRVRNRSRKAGNDRAQYRRSRRIGHIALLRRQGCIARAAFATVVGGCAVVVLQVFGHAGTGNRTSDRRRSAVEAVAGDARRVCRAVRRVVCRRRDAEQLDGEGKNHRF